MAGSKAALKAANPMESMSTYATAVKTPPEKPASAVPKRSGKPGFGGINLAALAAAAQAQSLRPKPKAELKSIPAFLKRGDFQD